MRRLQALLTERYTRRALAPRLGLHPNTLTLTAEQRIRLSTVLKLRRGYRMLLGDNLNENHAKG